MLDALLTIVVLGGILVLSAAVTELFARKMYRRCEGCGALNARRRARCRACGRPLVV